MQRDGWVQQVIGFGVAFVVGLYLLRADVLVRMAALLIQNIPEI